MAKKQTEKTPNDLNQIRSLLFGDQALQYDERFEALENSVNALRRENRSLRQALEVEAMARTSADSDQFDTLTSRREAALTDLTDVLIQHLQNEREKRATQLQAMIETVTAYQKHLDVQAQALIDQLTAERQERSRQFDALRDTLSSGNTRDDEVTDTLLSLLDGFRQSHIAPPDIINENGQS